MIRSVRTILIAIVLTLGWAAVLVAAPPLNAERSTTRENYPAIIKESADRRERAEQEWRRLLRAYRAQQTPPDFHPITYTPRSLLGIAEGINISGGKELDSTDQMALRQSARSFIDRWRDLIGADLSSISLTSETEARGIHILSYQQANYAYPVAGNFGTLTLGLTSDGRLSEFDDSVIPTVDLPGKPQVEKRDVPGLVAGRTFRYTGADAHTHLVTVAASSDVSVTRVVVLPVERGDALEVHLAWEAVVRKTHVWTVFLDAINGAELIVIQNS